MPGNLRSHMYQLFAVALSPLVAFALWSLAFGALVPAAIALGSAAVQETKPSVPTPAAIIEKHITAIGGRDALRSVKTMVIRGRNVGLGTEDRPLVRYLKRPHLLRQQDVPGATTFIASDGVKVYQVNASGRTEMKQAWTAALLHTTIDNALLEDTRQGIRYDYLGSEGTRTGPWTFHHLKRTFPDGYSEDLYFEAESGLLRMVIEDNGRAKRVYYEYRDVGGIRYPHLWATVFDGREPPHLFVVDEVRVNVTLDEGFFLK